MITLGEPLTLKVMRARRRRSCNPKRSGNAPSREGIGPPATGTSCVLVVIKISHPTGLRWSMVGTSALIAGSRPEPARRPSEATSALGTATRTGVIILGMVAPTTAVVFEPPY